MEKTKDLMVICIFCQQLVSISSIQINLCTNDTGILSKQSGGRSQTWTLTAEGCVEENKVMLLKFTALDIKLPPEFAQCAAKIQISGPRNSTPKGCDYSANSCYIFTSRSFVSRNASTALNCEGTIVAANSQISPIEVSFSFVRGNNLWWPTFRMEYTFLEDLASASTTNNPLITDARAMKTTTTRISSSDTSMLLVLAVVFGVLFAITLLALFTVVFRFYRAVKRAEKKPSVKYADEEENYYSIMTDLADARSRQNPHLNIATVPQTLYEVPGNGPGPTHTGRDSEYI